MADFNDRRMGHIGETRLLFLMAYAGISFMVAYFAVSPLGRDFAEEKFAMEGALTDEFGANPAMATAFNGLMQIFAALDCLPQLRPLKALHDARIQPLIAKGYELLPKCFPRSEHEPIPDRNALSHAVNFDYSKSALGLLTLDRLLMAFLAMGFGCGMALFVPFYMMYSGSDMYETETQDICLGASVAIALCSGSAAFWLTNRHANMTAVIQEPIPEEGGLNPL